MLTSPKLIDPLHIARGMGHLEVSCASLRESGSLVEARLVSPMATKVSPLAQHLTRLLVHPQTAKNGLAKHRAFGPAVEFDLGDEHGIHEAHFAHGN